MLLQTNSYVVPKDRRAEHARLLRHFRQTLARLGCESFEVYEQVGSNWGSEQSSGRFVQIMRFRDRRHQLAVQAAERNDPLAQQLIAEFCDLINFPYQQEQGLFATGFYTSLFAVGLRQAASEAAEAAPHAADEAAEAEPPLYPAAAETQLRVELPTDAVPLEEPPAETPLTHEPDLQPVAEAPLTQEPDLVGQPTRPFPAETDQSLHAQDNGQLESEAAAEIEPEYDEPEPLEASPVDLHPAELEPLEPPPLEHPVPADRFDDLLEHHFGPDPVEGDNGGGNGADLPAAARSTGSGIGQVLDRGLVDEDELDIPLPAELIDEPLELGSPRPEIDDGRAHE